MQIIEVRFKLTQTTKNNDISKTRDNGIHYILILNFVYYLVHKAYKSLQLSHGICHLFHVICDTRCT